MSGREPKRDGWSLLGFLHSVLGSGPRFWRLIVLILVLMFAYALAKGDVIAVYDHLTRHASGWAKWGIPPGSVGVTLGAMKFFSHHQAVQRKQVAEAKKGKGKGKGKGRGKGKKLPGNRRTAKPMP
jgi:hypothetical protein